MRTEWAAGGAGLGPGQAAEPLVGAPETCSVWTNAAALEGKPEGRQVHPRASFLPGCLNHCWGPIRTPRIPCTNLMGDPPPASSQRPVLGGALRPPGLKVPGGHTHKPGSKVPSGPQPPGQLPLPSCLGTRLRLTPGNPISAGAPHLLQPFHAS